MKTPLPLYHLRRNLRQQAQELRRAQRQAQAALAAEMVAAMDAFADRNAAEHHARVARFAADQERLITEAEGPPELLAALRRQLH